jgi:hypothetical protein
MDCSEAGTWRPQGIDEEKISVSVDKRLWQNALNQWDGPASNLVENLLFFRFGSSLETIAH